MVGMNYVSFLDQIVGGELEEKCINSKNKV